MVIVLRETAVEQASERQMQIFAPQVMKTKEAERADNKHQRCPAAVF